MLRDGLQSRAMPVILIAGLILIICIPVGLLLLFRGSSRLPSGKPVQVDNDEAFLHARAGRDAELLQAAEADPRVLKQRNAFGETVLHLAAVECEPETTRKLVELGADPLARVSLRGHQNYGHAPLHYALLADRLDTVRVFLELDAVRQMASAELADEHSALWLYGWEKTVQSLLDARDSASEATTTRSSASPGR